MNKKVQTTVKKRKIAILAVICSLVCIGLIILSMNLFAGNILTSVMGANSEYVILAVNDIGMHCYQPDYSGFLLLPPANTIKVQVFHNEGREAKLVNSGIEVTYQIIDNTTSADKINFWQYAKDYGYDVPPNIGITGNGLSGKMKLSEDGKFYEVTAVPLTPFNDGSTELNPYQLGLIKVIDSATGKELAMIDNVVVPVSNEMYCSTCHGTTDTDLNILNEHDKLSKTNLVADLANGKRYKCSDCHQDNILGAPGKPGILPLSQAMHGFHADKMAESDIDPTCYTCHPGPVTQCYRGVMYAEGITCYNTKCHGNMENVANSQANGRQAWLQEVNCADCHGEKYGVNAGLLYRNSYLINNENEEMNGMILCESCHNAPHAEWKSTKFKDNLLPIHLLGYPSFIDKCTVCHEESGVIHETIPQ